MIEELKLILSLLDGVAGMTVNLVYAFFAIKFLIFSSTTGAVVYCIRLVVLSVLDYAKSDMTRERADNIIQDCQQAYNKCDDLSISISELKSDARIAANEHRQELEKVQHLYKILKEAKGDE